MTPSSRSKAMRRVGSTCVALGLLLLPTGARADGAAASARESARALADEGADAFARGDYVRAHQHLQRAFSLVPAPTIAVLDARALASLGRLIEAGAAYRQALSTTVDDTSPRTFHEAVVHARTELVLLEQRIPRLTVRVRNAPREARVQVWLDGDEMVPRELGTPLAVDPRAYSVRLDIDGRQTAISRITLREGERRTVDLEAPSGGGLSRTLTVASFGLGGAGLITGVVAGSLALGARKDAESGCPARRCELGSRGAEALGDFRTYRTVSTIGYGFGAAGVALGTILLLAPTKESGAEVGLVPSFRGLNVRGAF
jgi:hypothetical protein